MMKIIINGLYENSKNTILPTYSKLKTYIFYECGLWTVEAQVHIFVCAER